LSGQRTLVISTDPAPSLGDALKRRLSGNPTTIPLRRGRLDALEIDAKRAFAGWIRSRRPMLERIALRGTWLDEQDVSRLLGLSLPGIDELAALFEITRLSETAAYDLIVVDTAPTGHTLRMLTMPETLGAVAQVFDRMQSRHRVIVEALRGRWVADAEDALIEQLDRDARALQSLLRDSARTRMSWVTLAEPMSIEETADATALLASAGMPIAELIVNRMTVAPSRPCPHCDRRIALERKGIADLARRLPSLRLVSVCARSSEPAGTVALAGIGREIAGAASPQIPARTAPKGRWRSTLSVDGSVDLTSIVGGDDIRLVLFGGKGGVGKTTSAAAASMAVARQLPTRRVMLVSTDPAHSIADAFGCEVSGTLAPIAGAPANLEAREIDAAALFRALRLRYTRAIDTAFDRLGASNGRIGVDASHDRRVMEGLVDLAPPGIDELAAIIDAADAIDADPAALLIMDTAPTGHALRLLEMPSLVQEWTRALMSIVLKYEPVTGIGELGSMLLELSKGLGRLRALLIDPGRAAFIVVTRAAALPTAETLRLVSRLREMKIHVPAMVVNAVGRGTCAVCRKAAAAEQKQIAKLRRRLRPPVTTILAPAELPPPHGPSSFRRWQEQWRS
jgi:arsenite-transporting ATPase